MSLKEAVYEGVGFILSPLAGYSAELLYKL
jgi:hypothetical protein